MAISHPSVALQLVKSFITLITYITFITFVALVALVTFVALVSHVAAKNHLYSVILSASEESRTPPCDIPRPFTLPRRTILYIEIFPNNTNT